MSVYTRSDNLTETSLSLVLHCTLSHVWFCSLQQDPPSGKNKWTAHANFTSANYDVLYLFLQLLQLQKHTFPCSSQDYPHQHSISISYCKISIWRLNLVWLLCWVAWKQHSNSSSFPSTLTTSKNKISYLDLAMDLKSSQILLPDTTERAHCWLLVACHGG